MTNVEKADMRETDRHELLRIPAALLLTTDEAAARGELPSDETGAELALTVIVLAAAVEVTIIELEGVEEDDVTDEDVAEDDGRDDNAGVDAEEATTVTSSGAAREEDGDGAAARVGEEPYAPRMTPYTWSGKPRESKMKIPPMPLFLT
jgi:hypothetical protein